MSQEPQRRLRVWEKYLSLWLVLGIGVGIGVGKVFPKMLEVNSW